MEPKLDHVVFGCLDLEAGVAALSERFGAPPSGRGFHEKMSTHNALWNMGDAYIELIAIDPAAPDPGRPRWFGLDDPEWRARLEDGPRLITWAISTDALEPIVAKAPTPTEPPEDFARDDLTWEVAMATSGTPGLDGCFPLLIHWKSGLHPARRLQDEGLRCASLALTHPRIASVREALGAIGAPVAMATGPSQIVLDLETPMGRTTFTAFD